MLKRADEWVSALEQLTMAKPTPSQVIIMNQEAKKKDDSDQAKPELRILAIELSEV